VVLNRLSGTTPPQRYERRDPYAGSDCAEVRRGGRGEAGKQAIDGLGQLGTSAHQVAPGGAINWHGPPAEVLARLEAAAEENGQRDLAVYSLAMWALVVSYPVFHFGQRKHPLWDRCIRDMGDAPAWDRAIALVRSPQWAAIWGNKQYEGAGPVVRALQDAKRDHQRC
jgi:hypothetical protein